MSLSLSESAEFRSAASPPSAEPAAAPVAPVAIPITPEPAAEPASIADDIPEPDGWEDPLTAADGPLLWRRLLESERSRSVRYGRPLTVVLVELEGLAPLARTWGRDVAVHTLQAAARSLRRGARSSDHVARIAADRFGVLLTETDEIAAINFVERIRESGARTLPKAAAGIRFAFGWSSPRAGESLDSLVGRAERRLEKDRAD